MTRRRWVSLPICLLAVTALVASPAGAAPPPQEFCGVCGEALTNAAEDAGVDLTVERATATVDVRADGRARWDARVTLGTGADRLAANATLRERIVRDTYDHGRTVVDDPRNLTTRVANGTLVVAFDTDEVARRSVGGVVLVDALDRSDQRSGLRLDADELRISGPNGSAVTNLPRGATVEGGTVVWRADEPGSGLFGDTPLAFAPGGGPAWQSATSVAVVTGGLGAPRSAAALGAIPALVFAAALGLVGRYGGRLPAVGPRLVVGVGTLGVLAATLSIAVPVDVGQFTAEGVLFGAALYAVVAACPLALDRPSVRSALAWTVAAVVLVTAAASVRSPVALRAALLSIPAALWFPAGLARRGSLPSRLLAVAVVASPFAAGLLVPSAAGVYWALLTALFTTLPWAVLTAAFGLPLYLLGRAAADAGDAVDGRDSPAAVSAE